MSRSYKKPYSTWVRCRSMKAWRTQENRRLRHNAKQLINTCKDYDALIIPVLNDYETLWGSPQDGRKRLRQAPYINQCEVDWYNRSGRGKWFYISLDRKGLPYDRPFEHHERHCDCYYNKRSWYWKMQRK